MVALESIWHWINIENDLTKTYFHIENDLTKTYFNLEMTLQTYFHKEKLL